MSKDIEGGIRIQELANVVDNMNENLRVSGASSAEQAFGIGCSLGLIPGTCVIILPLVFKVVSLILVSIILVLMVLIVIGVAVILSQLARRNGMDRAYQSQVEAEIAKFLGESGLTRAQFDQLFCNLLPPEAPLQAYLFPDRRSER